MSFEPKSFRIFTLWALLSLLVAAPASTQEEAASPPQNPQATWLAEHAIPLRSIDPTDEEFEDLKPLHEVLDGVQIVLLGEQTHGDGATFRAKGRLIRFLHQEMGFDVLAFESGLYDCAKAWELMLESQDPVKEIGQGVFGIWSRSQQVQPTFEYIAAQARTDHPLELAGFDSQFTGRASRKYLVADLESFAARHSLPFAHTESWPTFLKTLDRFAHDDYAAGNSPTPSPDQQRAFRRYLLTLSKQIAKAAKKSDREAQLWNQLFESLRNHSRSSWEVDPNVPMISNPELFELRDQQMGRNLVWLARERFANRKIIVWAATFHNARNLAAIEVNQPSLQELYDKIEVMGDTVKRELGERAYSLAFTAYEGRAGSVFGEPSRLRPAQPGSLEGWSHRAELENAWIDLRQVPEAKEAAWLLEPLFARPLGNTPMRAPWGQVVDGFLFTRIMEPSRRVESPADESVFSWRPVEVPAEVLAGDTLHNGFFLDDLQGWLITHFTGKVLHTQDGGKTWRKLSEVGEGYLETLQFLDPRHGWLSGDGGRLLRTEDGGATWKVVPGLPADAAFYSVHFFSPLRGFAAGLTAERKGVLLTTQDGGTSWRDRSPELPASFWSDALHTEGETAYLGGQGWLLVTRDSGQSWQARELPEPMMVRGLFFRGGHGWAVGHGGKILDTRDDGKSWRERAATGSPLLRDILFLGRRTGLAVGNATPEGAVLFETRDAGKSWRPSATHYPNLHRLLVTPRDLWAIGAEGTLLAEDS